MDYEIQSSAKLFSPTGLNIPVTTSRAQWEKIGEGITKLDRAIQWAIGDWLVFGDIKFGDISRDAERITGYKKGTLLNFKSLSHAFPPSRRRDDISWNHYQAMQALPEKRQNELIAEMETEHISVAELRNKIRGRAKITTEGTFKPRKTIQTLVHTATNKDEKNELIYALLDALNSTISDVGTVQNDTRLMGGLMKSMKNALSEMKKTDREYFIIKIQDVLKDLKK